MKNVMNALDMNISWFKDNRRELYNRFAEEYLVIHNREVIFAAPGLDDVGAYLRRYRFPRGSILVRECTLSDRVIQINPLISIAHE